MPDNFPWPKPKPKGPTNIIDWLRDKAREKGVGDFSGVNGPDGLNSRYNEYGSVTPSSTRISSNVMGSRGGGGGYLDNIRPSTTSGGGGYNSSSIEKAYAELIARLKGVGVDNSALVDQSIGAVKGNYSAADSDIFKQYTGARDDLTGRAGNLGVDYGNSQMGQNYDAALRRIQEMSNSNLNSDLSYFEKMRDLKQGAIDAMIVGAEQEKAQKIAQAQAAMRAAASKATKDSLKGTETQTLDNVGDVALYKELLRSNPAAAKAFISAYTDSSMDPDAAMAQLNKSRYLPTIKGWGWSTKGANAPYKKAIEEAMAAMLGLTGKMGNPDITQKVSF